MEEELKLIQEIFPEATLRHDTDRMVYRLYFDASPRNRGKSYITDNHITGYYCMFLDGFFIHNKDFNKILAVLKAIKSCEEG